MFDRIVHDDVITAHGQPGTQSDDITVLQGLWTLPRVVAYVSVDCEFSNVKRLDDISVPFPPVLNVVQDIVHGLRGNVLAHHPTLDLVKRLFLLEDLDPDGDPGLVVTEAPTGFARTFSSEVAERAVVRDESIVSRHLPWAV